MGVQEDGYHREVLAVDGVAVREVGRPVGLEEDRPEGPELL